MSTETEPTETTDVPTADRATAPENWEHLRQPTNIPHAVQHPSSLNDDLGGAD